MNDVLRQPPSAIEAEQNVLGSLLLANEAFAQLADWVSEEDFYRHDHRIIWRAIAEHVEKHQPCDAVTLMDWLSRNGEQCDSAYVLELANNTASAANIVAYAEIVVEKSRLRKLIEIGTRMTGDAFAAQSASRDLSASATHDLAQLATAERGGLVPVKAGLQALFAGMSDRYANGRGLLGLPTPWREINDWTRGLQRKKLYIVGARPGMGKSIFGGQIAAMNALRGANVAWFSVEMSSAECMERAVSAIGNVDYEWVQSPDKDDPDCELHWSAVARAMEQLSNASLLIDDTPALSRMQFMARSRRAHMRRKLDLIVVDHMHDMTIDPRRESRFEYEAIAQAGKTLAKELDCAVLLEAQLSRDLEKRANKRPVMSDLRETGAIEQKADAIMFLYRDDYYEPQKNRGVVEVICAKGRGLKPRSSPIHLQNRFDRMRMEDYNGPPIEDATVIDEAVARWERQAKRAAA